MKLSYLMLSAVMVSGCIGIQEVSRDTRAPVKTFLDVHRAKEGMSLQEVKTILGESVTIGYKEREQGRGSLEPITIKNPFRAEELHSQGRTLTVLYYVTAIQRADDIVSDDELTPLIFEHGRLVGKDRDFLLSVKQNL